MASRNYILAYTAGIIDGEGCIGIYQNVIKGKTYSHLTVSVVNTNEWLLHWLKFNFGGTFTEYQPLQPTCKDSYKWSLHSKKANDFLSMILPFLQLKKPQAELAINYQKRKYLTGRKGKTDKERALDEVDCLLMHSYNKRGK